MAACRWVTPSFRRVGVRFRFFGRFGMGERCGRMLHQHRRMPGFAMGDGGLSMLNSLREML